jgi:hypothetical protein
MRRVEFRHVIESLRSKPRTLLRTRLKSDLLPGSRPGLIQSMSQIPWPWLPAWVEVGVIALFL